MRVKIVFSFIVSLVAVYSVSVKAQTFSLLLPSNQVNCSTASTQFTTGQQYVDPNNGVPYDSWSMLVRWQGTSIPGPTQWYSNPVSNQIQ